MTDPIAAIGSGLTRLAYQTTVSTDLTELGAQGATGNLPSSQLDKEAFLKLLVAQLRYQDPLNPNDPAEFMATTAQFTTIEKLDELTKQGSNAAILNGLSMAGSLVGRSVTYLDADEVRQTAVVSSAEVIAGEVKLITDKGPVSMTSIMGIGAVAMSAPT